MGFTFKRSSIRDFGTDIVPCGEDESVTIAWVELATYDYWRLRSFMLGRIWLRVFHGFGYTDSRLHRSLTLIP